MRTRFLAIISGLLAATLVGPASALADHPPVQDPSFFDEIFAPTVASLPPWLVIGILPALVLLLLAAAGFWAWRNGGIGGDPAVPEDLD